MIMFGDQMLLQCQLVHLYWTLHGEDNGLSFYLPLSWYMHHVCRTFLKSEGRYAVNFLYFHYQIRNFRHRKKMLKGEKANISVHSQLCVGCAFICIMHWHRN